MPLSTQSLASAASQTTISPTDTRHQIVLQLQARADGTLHLVCGMTLAERDAAQNIRGLHCGGVDLDDAEAIAAAQIASADVDAVKRVLLAAGAAIAAQNGFTVSP